MVLYLRYRKVAETLKRNEQELDIATMTFQSYEAIMVTDANRNIIRINPSFTRITGYTEADVIGKTPNILSSGKHDSIFFENFWSSIKSKGKWDGEIWNQRKNGEIFPEWQTVLVVKNKQGVITHYISFFTDITEFKLAEKKNKKIIIL